MRSGSQVADFVTNYLHELDGLTLLLPERRIHTTRQVAPQGLRFKINFDAAFNRQKNESCSGLVVRNGEVICSKTIINANILSGFVAEALACLQTINLGLHLGLRDVELRVTLGRLFVSCKRRKKIDLRLLSSLKIQRNCPWVSNIVVFFSSTWKPTRLLTLLLLKVLKKGRTLICCRWFLMALQWWRMLAEMDELLDGDKRSES